MIGRYQQQKASSILMLGALLLFMAGAVLHPFAHTAAVTGAAAAAATLPTEGPSPAPAGDDGHEQCVACTLTRAAALPALPVLAAVESVVPAPTVLAEGLGERAPPQLTSTLPRAPPRT